VKLIEIKRRIKRRLEKELPEIDRRLADLKEQIFLLEFLEICESYIKPKRKIR